MARRNNKIKRYNSIYGPNRKKQVFRAIGMVLSMVVLFSAGWLVYEPVVNFVRELQSPPQPIPPSTISSSSQPQDDGNQLDTTPVAQEPAPLAQLAYLPASVVSDAALFETNIAVLKQQGVQGVVFDLKEPLGMVLYESSLPGVKRVGAQPANPYNLAEVVQRIEQAGMQPVGRIYAFRDATAAKAMYDSAVKYSGTTYNWVDNAPTAGGKPWLNPYDAAARKYNLDIITEALGQGVKSIVVDGLQFPTGYSLDKADYGPAAATAGRAETLLSFAHEAQALVKAGNANGHCWVFLPGLALAQRETDPLSPYGGEIAKLATYPELIVDCMPISLGEGIATEQLTIPNPAQSPTEAITALVAAFGSNTGEITPIVQAFSPQGQPAITKEQVLAQQTALSQAGLSHRMLYWSPNGSYAVLGAN